MIPLGPAAGMAMVAALPLMIDSLPGDSLILANIPVDVTVVIWKSLFGAVAVVFYMRN